MSRFKEIKIGISTTILREHPVTYAIEYIALAGYSAAEVWQWHIERYDETPATIARRACELGMPLTMHLSGENINPISGDPDIVQMSKRQIEMGLQIAADIGASVVTIHPGKRTSEHESIDHIWECFHRWVDELNRMASYKNLKIGLELMEKLPMEIFMTSKDAARLMKVPRSNIGLTIDVAHMNTHWDPVRFMDGINPSWINHVHLSDNAPWGIHLPLGEGRIDFGSILQGLERIQYDGIISIEGSIPEQGAELLLNNIAYLHKIGWGPAKPNINP